MPAVTEPQRRLVEGLMNWLGAQPCIEAAWLAGSLGAGGGDAFSDVDILALTGEGSLAEAMAALGSEDLERAFDAVLVHRHFGGRVITVVTADWDRFDITLVEAANLGRYDAKRLEPLFNRGQCAPPAHAPKPYTATAETVLPLVQEAMRILGLTPLAVGREEYLVGMQGVDLLRGLAMNLMMEANGVGPTERGGALRRNPFLTDEQRATLSSVPPSTPTASGVIEPSLALGRIILSLGRVLVDRTGAAWPYRLEAALRRRLSVTLGLEI